MKKFQNVFQTWGYSLFTAMVVLAFLSSPLFAHAILDITFTDPSIGPHSSQVAPGSNSMERALEGSFMQSALELDLEEEGAGTDANIGLARIGTHSSGGNVYMSWDNDNMPVAPTGFVVARSTSPTDGFAQLSGLISPQAPSYVDEGPAPGTYYYVVVIVKSDMSWEQWTEVSEPNVVP